MTGLQGLPGVQGPQGPAGGNIFKGSSNLPTLASEPTTCPAPQQDLGDYADLGNTITLGPGLYRPVFAGATTVGHSGAGTAEVAIYVWTLYGITVSDYGKSTSSGGVFEKTFQYFHVDETSPFYVYGRASTTCGGTASLYGVLAFERVAD